ncbi:hypothetical protein EYC84_006919 [Monilinia fructicola]|uniref:Uncharacterized protein n=1 Tax=Monilinia fructicola TaxID=38448 RepID=A0A5M9K8Q4_MONFR|nr:hypothetical protein EYC84_006919 [Monilinia fructicola]
MQTPLVPVVRGPQSVVRGHWTVLVLSSPVRQQDSSSPPRTHAPTITPPPENPSRFVSAPIYYLMGMHERRA